MSQLGSTPDAAPYDFRRPTVVTGPLLRPLLAWHDRARLVLPEKLAPICPVPFRWASEPIRSRLASDPLDPPHIGCPVHIGPEHDLTLLVVPRPFALTAVQAMLGDSSGELVEDRRMTSLETALFEMLLDGLIEALEESRPAELPPGFQRRPPIDPVQPARLFPAGPRLACLDFLVEAPFGQGRVSWMWPETLVEHRFQQPAQAPQAEPDVQVMQNVARQLPLQLVVRLGSARIGVSQLAQLQVGDVIVLDQRVEDAVTAIIDGRERLLGWPVRQGTRQAFQIARVLP